MTTNNHPAHGPVSLDRLHQIREILSKASAQSDGGNLGYAMADAVKVIAWVLSIPATLPCPVHLEPGLKFGKGVRTQCLLDALRRRTDYYAELEAMTPEQREEHDAGIAEFKAMLGNGGRGDMVDNDMQHTIQTAPALDTDGKSAFPQRSMQSFGNSEQLDEVGSWNNHMNTPTAHAGNSPVTPDCWCRTCRPVTMNDMRFVVCPDCGNKRCPHANDHNNACTGSNEPGQVGSAYPAAPQQEVK